MADIVMPRLSDTMEEGTILRWCKDDGEHVARGEELVEIETDKATMTYESDQAGVLQIVAAVGDSLAVGQLIARVGAADGSGPPDRAGGGAAAGDREGPAREGPASVSARSSNASARGSNTPLASPAGASRETPGGEGAPGETRADEGTPRETPAGEGTPGETRAGERTPRETPAGANASGAGRETGEAGEAGARVKASPLARRIARESGVELRALSGTGPGGRIVKADVVGVPATVEGVTTAKGHVTELELSRTQQTVARRMAESKATIPDFTLQIEVDMEACVTLRTQLKRLSTPHGGRQEQADAPDTRAHEVPTYNDMVVKAAALALREHPHANGSYRDGRVQVYARVNVGVAVAAEGEGALVVPTVFDADEKSLGEIAREARTLAARVRSGEITPPELGGGTFTVSNLGMYGIRSFTAIVNPPQAGILSVGALGPRAVVHAGEVVARNTMTLTLACDHRILYGAQAARFLARVRELLEAPAALTL